MGRVLLKFNPFDNTITTVERTSGATTTYRPLSFDGTYIWIGRIDIGFPFIIAKKFVHLRKWDFVPGVNIIFPVNSISANYTVKDTDYTILANSSGGNITISLPTAVGRKGKIFNIKKIDATANTVTIDPNGVETIDGSAAKAINLPFASITIQSDDSNWMII